MTETLLQEALHKRQLIIYLGADLPQLVTGLPSQAELARAMAQRHGLPENLSLAQTAQRVMQAGSRYEFTAFLRQSLDITGKPLPAFYARLAALAKQHSIRTIITTTYDGLLEQALLQAGVAFNRVVRGVDVNFIDPNRLTVLKLYGELDQPDTLVVTEQDHTALLRDQGREPLLDEVRQTFRHNTVLFIGYNLADPDFHFIYEEIGGSKFARLAYAVCPGLPEVEVRMWRQRNIILLESDSFGLLTGSVIFEQAHSTESAVPATGGGKAGKGDGEAITPDLPLTGTGDAWALLVGVNNYEDTHIPTLHVCATDVTVIHSQLAPRYRVTRLLSDDSPQGLPRRANILGGLVSLAQNAGPEDLVLFYFSGHGYAQGGESYLLPCDTRLAALEYTAVSMRDVHQILDASPARAKVIILDACHSGAAIGKAGAAMTPEFIQRVFEQAEGMAVMASCKQGQQSYEWPEKGQSAFTYYLQEALTGLADLDGKGFVTVSDASRYVTDRVKAWAAAQGAPQTPTLQYTVAGDIILLRR